MEKRYELILRCSFFVDEKLKEIKGIDQDVVGFTLPDGRTVRPIAGFLLDDSQGITSELTMQELGMELGDYDTTVFLEEE
jgi:hypothetical protein